MNKTLRTGIGMAVALLLAGAAAAEDGGRIAVVDIEQAINSTDEGKAAREEFARKQREAEGQLQPIIERGRALEEEVKSKRFVLSQDALYQKQLDLVELQNELKTKRDELEGKLKVDYERLVAPLRAKLRSIVEDLGKSEGYALILERGTPGVLYSREALDITDTVIEKFNKKG
ncbi:MAG: OmpH family outer membrane protein [Myxococcota bacterium]|nr:OmpH family outer membrane protein [Myxococcota bacterium]